MGWTVRGSNPVQTRTGAYPASYTMGTGSLPGVKRPGRGVDHPPASSAEVKERLELYLYSTSGPSWSVLGWTLPLPYQHPMYVESDIWEKGKQAMSSEREYLLAIFIFSFIPVPCIFHYFLRWPTNLQLIYKLLNYSYVFWHYFIILRELVVST
jgi:hypothetical protein